MEEHHCPGMDAGKKFGEGLFFAGLLILIPVHISKAPKYGAVAQLLGLLQIALAVLALRRTVILLHFLAGGFFIQGLQGRKLLFKGGFFGDRGHIRVVIGMVSHQMPFLHHPLYQFRAGLDIIAHHKKRRLDGMLLQSVQNGGGIAVFIPGVKGGTKVSRSFLTARVVELRFPHRKFPRDTKLLKSVPQSFVSRLSVRMHTSWHGQQHRGHFHPTLHFV